MPKRKVKQRTNLLPFFIYLCFLILLTSCGAGTDKGTPDFEPDMSDLTPGDISDRLVARIYFDTSVSMQGFVVPNSTRYTRILRYLESAIVSGWNTGKAEFFRFGEQVRPINRDSYLRAGSVGFYDDIRTFIQKIFEYEDQLANENIEINNTSGDSIDAITPSESISNDKKENRLVVIVTDLFQDRGDINLLVSQLKDKYIKNGLEVGLLGLRSEFNGKVYNLGTAPVTYRSRPGNPETFRPFYLLVLGRHADIAHYFDRLIANGFSEAKTVIFSQYLVNPLLSFDRAEIEKLENLIRDTITEEPDSRLKEYRIREKDETSKISAKMKYELLPHVMPFNSNTFDPSIIVEHNRTDSDRKNEISRAAHNCLEVTSELAENGNENELIVNFELDSRVLLRKTVYLYKVILRPKIDTYQVPEWCSDWDMGTGRNGAKTLNLVNFVDGLTDITVNEHQPKIAQFYFYVEKR